MELAFVIYLIDNIAALKDHIFGLMEMSVNEFKESVIYTFYKKLVKSWFYIFLPMCLLGSVFNIVLPSKDTAYKMLAAYGLQETVEAASKSEDVKRLASKSLSLIERSIDDYNKSLDNKAKQENNESKDKKD